MGSSPRIDRLCRVCTVEQIEGVSIYSDEGKKSYLEAKLKKYLYILVSPDDRLPKVLCRSCSRRLDSIHRFASQALESQERLLQMVEVKKMEDLKVEEEIKFQESPQEEYEEAEAGVTEVEVRVDPMSFLCVMETSGGGNSSDFVDGGEAVPALVQEELEEAQKRLEEAEERKEEEKLSTAFRLSCWECGGVRFPTYTLLDTHCRNVHRQRGVAECRECGKRVTLASRLLAHRLQHTGIFPYRCDECGKGFEMRCLLKKHKNSHIDEKQKPFQCALCEVGFLSEIGLQNHLWSHFPRGRRLLMDAESCEKLGEAVGSVPSFLCPLCSKRLSTKGNLKVHLETHRPKGKYGCDICGRIFKTQSNLYRHKEYHKGKQFPCSTCGRVYPTRSTLRAHSITHSDLRPHSCPFCEKTFKRNQDLKFHLNQHTGARPYKCPYCPKAFASSGNCFSHRKRMHTKEVERDRVQIQ